MTYHFFMGSTFYIYTINLKTNTIQRKLFVMQLVTEIKSSMKQTSVEKNKCLLTCIIASPINNIPVCSAVGLQKD